MNPTIERTLGRWLKNVRAGDRHLAWNDPRFTAAPDTILLTSSAFDESEIIPQRHAGEGVGENISPPLSWSVLPFGTVELVLIMQDPDAPMRRPVVHLLVTGIAPERGSVPEGYLTPETSRDLRFGRGLFGRLGYAGPRPVRAHGRHRYIFQIFALSRRLDFKVTPDYAAVTKAMTGAVLARGRLIGAYERK
ncbi:MAG TPA: YbhB/YbcL family Raf kinase inhibitor-like protein [Magnetospirillaceae bacterium]|jgi:hypothetical protein